MFHFKTKDDKRQRRQVESCGLIAVNMVLNLSIDLTILDELTAKMIISGFGEFAYLEAT